jgi:hypothetical protein
MQPLTVRFLARVVKATCERPLVTLLIALALAAAALVFTASHFSMTSDTTKLISDKVDWRQREIAMSKAFPQQGDTTVVVVDGATPELAEAAAAALAARLEPGKDLFLSVRRPDGGPFFAREGLLYLSTPEVEATTEQLVAAQPFLGAMAADPSLRGVMTAVSTLAQGVSEGQTSLASVDKPITSLGAALEAVAAGKTRYFSGSTMTT